MHHFSIIGGTIALGGLRDYGGKMNWPCLLIALFVTLVAGALIGAIGGIVWDLVEKFQKHED